MEEHIRPKRKIKTVELFDGFIKKHIVPALGTKLAASVASSDLSRLHRKIGLDHPVLANRVLSLIGSVYRYGTKTGALEANLPNPTSGIQCFREHRRERFLTDEELHKLGEAIREAETVGIDWPNFDESNPNIKHAPRNTVLRRSIMGPHAAAALRLLLFTGARLREVLHLQWENVDFQRGLAFLQDSKTGKKTLVLGSPALAILSNVPRMSTYVIAGLTRNKPRSDLQRPWALVCHRAGLKGLRLHDLRHSFASVGAASGLGLPIIGKLLGHANTATTERYAHLAVDPLRRATDDISNRIATAMGDKTATL